MCNFQAIKNVKGLNVCILLHTLTTIFSHISCYHVGNPDFKSFLTLFQSVFALSPFVLAIQYLCTDNKECLPANADDSWSHTAVHVKSKEKRRSNFPWLKVKIWILELFRGFPQKFMENVFLEAFLIKLRYLMILFFQNIYQILS